MIHGWYSQLVTCSASEVRKDCLEQKMVEECTIESYHICMCNKSDWCKSSNHKCVKIFHAKEVAIVNGLPNTICMGICRWSFRKKNSLIRCALLGTEDGHVMLCWLKKPFSSLLIGCEIQQQFSSCAAEFGP